MLVGNINYPHTYGNLLTHPAWQIVFDWIAKNKNAADGEYDIKNRDIYASVQTIATVPPEQAVFEAHREYIDLHYCIEGGEIIKWAPVDMLSPQTEYDTEKDYALYEPIDASSEVLLTPNTFAIFFPADAHMPKISDGKNETTKKVVVKIRNDFLLKQ